MAHDSEIEPASPAPPPLPKLHRRPTSTMADDDEEPRLLSHVTYQMPSPPPLPLPPMLPPLPTMPSVLPSLSTPVRPTVGRSQHQSPSPSRARSRAPNYSASDVEVLLDTVRDVLPLGANEWATVAERFNNESGAAGTYRDQDSLKKKFDKLANMKKSTGDPSCPPEVRAAKQIARDIVGRANAGIVGDTSEEDAQSMGTNDGRDSGERNTVGVFKRKRAEARRGVKRRRLEVNDMSHQVRRMSDAVTTLVESMASDGGAGSGEGDLDARVKEAVREQIAETRGLIEKQQESMEEMKRMMHMLLARNPVSEE